MSSEYVAHVDESLADLIPRYLERRRADIEAIRVAVATQDLPTAQSLGHSMKGSGGGYGFQDITTFGGDIEDAAVGGDSATVLGLVEQLVTYLDTVRIEFVAEDDD